MSVVTPMALSTAINLGAMLKPQGKASFLSGGRTCALGAALDAIGQLDSHGNNFNGYALAAHAFPLLRSTVQHPDFPKMSLPLWRAVEDLNDCRGRTREAIATWVSTIEQDQEHAAQVEAADVFCVG